MKKELGFNINICHYSELNYSYLNPKGIEPNIELKDFPTESELGLKYTWNIEKNVFGIIVTLKLKGRSDTIKETLIDLTYLIEFSVEDLSSYFTVKSADSFEIDKTLEYVMVNTAISIGRGVFLEKSSGTVFKHLIFPLIDANKFLLSNRVKKKDR